MRYLKREIIPYIGEDSWSYPLLLVCVQRSWRGLVWLAGIRLEKLMGIVRLAGILKNRGSWLLGLTGCLYFGDYMVISLFSLSFGIWTEICG